MSQVQDYGPLFSGQMLRDAGITLVKSHNDGWMDQCLELAVKYAHARGRSDFTGEDIRFFCENVVPAPRHPNAWGALVNILVKRKIIRATGEYRQPKDRSSHARAIQVYTSLA
jgi:hypothetical protein